MSIERVPTLNLEVMERDPEAFIADLGAAYERFGFCGIRNHGIDSSAVEAAYRELRLFFNLPPETKQRYRIPGIGGARGYTGFGVETAKDSEHPDLKEFWQVGRDLPPGHRFRDIMQDNIWPEEVPGFRPALTRLYDELDQLGRRILSAMALYLQQEADFFEARVDHGNSILRPIRYPPIGVADTPSIRAGEHEDINLITLLIGSDEPGLEILSRTNEWIPVTTIPGAIVCNIGDMMQRLTNHVFPSTTHRVVNPTGDGGLRSRYSIPFFLHPNPDLVIETLPSCISNERPNRYPEPITANDYLTDRLREIGLL